MHESIHASFIHPAWAHAGLSHEELGHTDSVMLACQLQGINAIQPHSPWVATSSYQHLQCVKVSTFGGCHHCCLAAFGALWRAKDGLGDKGIDR